MSIDLFKTLQSIGLPAPKGILQVGASYGQEFKQFLEQGVRHGVMVEPLPEPFQHIAGMCKQVPGFVAVNALCSDVAGRHHSFHVASNGGMSSSVLAPKDHLQVFDYVKFEQTIELVSTTVDDIVTLLNNNGHAGTVRQLDTLYMDVQGAEFKVLLGAGRTLDTINYIFMELIRGELYEGMVPLATYCAMLEAQGFTLNNINYCAQHHADALFVRKSLVGLK
jgi:FkbM family methyltransferase